MKINTLYIFVYLLSLSIAANGDVSYKNRDIDPESTLEVMGVGSLFEERVVFIQLKSVNLINSETEKRERVPKFDLLIKESAFVKSFESIPPKILSNVKYYGDVSQIENAVVWSISIGDALDEIDEMLLSEPVTFSKYIFSGQWKWLVTPDCFNNYSFNDKGEFVGVHGNGLNIGTYKVVKMVSEYEFIVSVEVNEVVRGDVSCGRNWFQDLGKGSALLLLVVKNNNEELRIFNAEENTKTLGPFEKI